MTALVNSDCAIELTGCRKTSGEGDLTSFHRRVVRVYTLSESAELDCKNLSLAACVHSQPIRPLHIHERSVCHRRPSEPLGRIHRIPVKVRTNTFECKSGERIQVPAGLQHLRNRPSRGLCRSFTKSSKMSYVAEIRQNVFLLYLLTLTALPMPSCPSDHETPPNHSPSGREYQEPPSPETHTAAPILA